MKTYRLVLVLVLCMLPWAAFVAAEPIWRWVDENGHVIYSNLRPPVQARDVTVIESRWSADENRPPSAAGPHSTAQPGHHPWLEAYNMLLDELNDLRGYVDELGDDGSDARYILYTPEFDYAYSRRYYRGPRRHRRDDVDRRERHQRALKPFGARRYDHSYFSGAYRYRSNLPTFGADRAARAPVRRFANQDGHAYSKSQAHPDRASGDGPRR
ncbi:MAG: DUF4124 domain-containing protein [Desulfobacterales bacterium]|nr:DUF4124 domain-containing protein [Desulfobacterales bacterium]